MKWLGYLLGFLFRSRPLPQPIQSEDAPQEQVDQVRMTVEAFGETRDMGVPANPDGTAQYTAEQLGKMTIRCAFCRGAIFIGEPVVISELEPGTVEDLRMIEGIHFVSDDPPTALTCYTIGPCTIPGMLPSGDWLPSNTDPSKGMIVPRQTQVFTG